MIVAFLCLGIIGLVTSSVYGLLVLVAAIRFSRQRAAESCARSESCPLLSLLKPLHGDEFDLESRLVSFFEQDYPEYEVLFCARHLSDAGLQLAKRVAARYPAVPVRFLTTGEPRYWNAKVASLERMAAAARSEILVISDSDVRVGPDYLRAVAAPFIDSRVGLVTCLYRGIAEGAGFWSRLEATGMSVEMTSGVLVAEMLEGMQFALGPTMAVRRECVTEAGGFGALGRYCADDFVLGNRIAANGHKVVLSSHVIDHIVLNEHFSKSIQHQIRWMKSTRFSRPKGHLGTALTFSVPFGLMACIAALVLRMPVLAVSALGWSVVSRMILAAIVSAAVVRERRWWQGALVYPLRDLMGFFYWAASYGSNRILWRGEIFELLSGGVMRPCDQSREVEFPAIQIVDENEALSTPR